MRPSFLSRIGAWREDPQRRRAQQAFLEDIAEHWSPQTASDRHLETRSRIAHAWDRLTGGAPSLASVAVAALPCALGSGLLTFAPTPATAGYVTTASAPASLLLTIGIIGVMIEAARSPRALHARRFTVQGALPVTIAGVAGAGTIGHSYPADRILTVALIVLATGTGLICLATTLRWATARVYHAGLAIAGTGCLLIAAADGPWMLMMYNDHAVTAAAGCLFSSLGAATIGIGLLRSTPVVVN